MESVLAVYVQPVMALGWREQAVAGWEEAMVVVDVEEERA